MSRYIDQDKVIDAVLNLDTTHRVSWRDAVIDMIDAMPSEDVQPVVHGEWIPVTAIYKVKEDQFPQTERVWVDATEPDEIDAVKCSICGEVFDFADARNWCTECGAKMDKRKGADT